MKNRKRWASVAFATLLCVAMALSGGVCVTAQETLSPVTLYALDEWASAFLSIPGEFPTTHQISIAGETIKRCRVEQGASVEVTDSGRVTPRATVWYWKGGVGSTGVIEDYEYTVTKYAYEDATVTVETNKSTYTLLVTVANYAREYARADMRRYVAEQIPDTLTEVEKLHKVCEYVANFRYDAEHSSATGMVVSGGGDCWASTDTILILCDMLGIEAWARNGNRDAGAGSGHMNAMAIADGEYYELEAGYYTTSTPRPYSVDKRSSLFCVNYNSEFGGCEVYQYDGRPSDEATVLEIPAHIGQFDVVGIDKTAFQGEAFKEIRLPDTVKHIGQAAFWGSKIERMHLPRGVEKIDRFAFNLCEELTEFTVDSDNEYFSAEAGVLYNKDKTVLLYAPTAEEFTVPDGVTELGEAAFRYSGKLTAVKLPASVTKIGDGVFDGVYSLREITLTNAVTEIGQFAFSAPSLTIHFLGTPEEWEQIHIVEDGNEALASATMVYHTYTETVIPPTCTKEGYTLHSCTACDDEYKDTFVPAFGGEHVVVIDPAVEPTETEDGKTAGRHCSVCGEVLVEQMVIPALNTLLGDANGDRAVNMKDVLALRKHLAGLSADVDRKNADVTGDGEVNMKDVLALRKFLAGLISEFAV